MGDFSLKESILTSRSGWPVGGWTSQSYPLRILLFEDAESSNQRKSEVNVYFLEQFGNFPTTMEHKQTGLKKIAAWYLWIWWLSCHLCHGTSIRWWAWYLLLDTVWCVKVQRSPPPFWWIWTYQKPDIWTLSAADIKSPWKSMKFVQMKVFFWDTSPIFIGEVLVSGSVQPSSTGGLTGEVWSINSFDEVSITAFLDPPWSLRKTGARKIFKQFFLPAIYIESSDFLIGSKEGWLVDFLRCKTGHKTQFWKVACFIPRGVLRMWCFKLWPFMTLELSLVKDCVVY